MKRYEKYKDSGIEWIGEIPEHWEVKKIKYIGKTLAGGTPSTSNKEFWNGNIPWLQSGKVQNNIIELKQVNKFITEKGLNNSATKLIKSKSVLIALTGATCGNIGYLTFPSTANQSVVAIENYSNSISKFLFYNLLSQREQILIHKSGGAQSGINEENVKNLVLTLPPLQEQTAIAHYLDRKTAQIDELIADKKRLLELYEEEKTAIINQAVTKGINPNVPMKDSGIEWLGEIPEHWEVKRINGVSGFVRGNSNFKKDELLNNGKYVALQYGKTYKVNEIDEKYEFYVNDEFYKISQVVKFGDVILISTSETIDDLGHSVFYNRKDMGLLGGEQILLRPNWEIVDYKYLYYSSKVFKMELRKYATGIKVFRFNIHDLKNIYISIPPLPEQIAIVEYIQKEIARINAKVEKTKKLIELLEEYKQVLISEVVTGKIKVV